MATLNLQNENPTIANVVIDRFGTTTGMSCELLTYLYMCIYVFYVGAGKNQCIIDCDKADLDDENG